MRYTASLFGGLCFAVAVAAAPHVRQGDNGGPPLIPAVPAGRFHTVVLYGTTPERNQGYVIDPTGMMRGDFALNPVLLYDHELSALKVVGSVSNIREDGEYLLADIDFLDKPFGWQGPWIPDQLEAAFDAGVAAVSVHIAVLEWREPTAEDFMIYGPLVKRVVTSSSLLEVSVVAIGAFHDSVPLIRIQP